MQDLSVAELARRAGVTSDDVLEFEAGRLILAKPPFVAYMTAMGVSV